ncbi:MAG TPA: heavy metal-associated domain-containing protein [Deinococcales bacterium]|nr:heavy metal-associated domain-containing protein [Deinococcales bacterium]
MSMELNVTGMTCGHCKTAVEKALKGVPGVTDVNVDLSAGKAVVQGNPDPNQLVAAVTEEGYGASIQG